MSLAFICAANGIKGADVLREVRQKSEGQDQEHARY